MQQLIDDRFLERLGTLRFTSKHRRGGRFTGFHTSPRAGMSVEFADYREYAPGDDFRYIDWNIYGRLGRLLVKTFVQEVDLPVHLLLDLSASMNLGHPQKAPYAAQIALALAYLALRSQDRVGLYPFSQSLRETVPVRHGMAQFSRFLRLLTVAEAAGTTSWDASIDGFMSQTREAGVTVLISDFLGDDSLERPLARLRHRGDELVAIQVLDRQDIEPILSGSTQIVDIETGLKTTLSVGAGTLAAYRKRFDAYERRLASTFLRHNVPWFMAPTDRPLETLIHQDLRRGGILT